MALETISLKIEKGLARRIDERLKESNYSTKTEFIREAIRGKLSQMDEEDEKRKAWAALFAARGIFKGKAKKISEDEVDRMIREHYDKKFGIKLT